MGASDRRVIELPPRWQISQLSIHFEGEDLSKDPNPFAANIVGQLRLDLEPGDPLSRVVDGDIDNAKKALDAFNLVSKKVMKTSAEVECLYASGDQEFRQLSFYREVSGSVYTVVATHRAERFESVRKDLLAIVNGILASVG